MNNINSNQNIIISKEDMINKRIIAKIIKIHGKKRAKAEQGQVYKSPKISMLLSRMQQNLWEQTAP